MVPEAGAIDARNCVHSVDVFSDQALVGARARLNPAAGLMVSGLWVADAGQLVMLIHHLAIDAVSWRVVLDDLNTAWAQHRSGQPVVLPATGTSFARWAGLLVEYARRREVVELADAWKQVAGAPAVLPPPQSAVDTYASAGHLSVGLEPETTGLLFGAVPAAFHAGVQEILLIALGLAVAQFVGNGAAPVGIDVEGHGRHEELGAQVRPVAHGGLVHQQIPGGVECRWALVAAGGRR